MSADVNSSYILFAFISISLAQFKHSAFNFPFFYPLKSSYLYIFIFSNYSIHSGGIGPPKIYQKVRGIFAHCTWGIASGMPIPSDHSPEGTNRAPSEDSAEGIG
jgi:hypothetical protein